MKITLFIMATIFLLSCTSIGARESKSVFRNNNTGSYVIFTKSEVTVDRSLSIKLKECSDSEFWCLRSVQVGFELRIPKKCAGSSIIDSMPSGHKIWRLLPHTDEIDFSFINDPIWLFTISYSGELRAVYFNNGDIFKEDGRGGHFDTLNKSRYQFVSGEQLFPGCK